MKKFFLGIILSIGMQVCLQAQTVGGLDPDYGTSQNIAGVIVNSWVNQIIPDVGGVQTDTVVYSCFQLDRKMLVLCKTTQGTTKGFSILRYLENGVLDTSFGTAGKLFFSFASLPNCDPNFILVHSDGNIYVSGRNWDSAASIGTIFVAKLSGAGAIDPAFGTAGLATYSSASGNVEQTGFAKLVIQTSGRLIVSSGSGLIGFLSSGMSDSSFSVNGFFALSAQQNVSLYRTYYSSYSGTYNQSSNSNPSRSLIDFEVLNDGNLKILVSAQAYLTDYAYTGYSYYDCGYYYQCGSYCCSYNWLGSCTSYCSNWCYYYQTCNYTYEAWSSALFYKPVLYTVGSNGNYIGIQTDPTVEYDSFTGYSKKLQLAKLQNNFVAVFDDYRNEIKTFDSSSNNSVKTNAFSINSSLLSSMIVQKDDKIVISQISGSSMKSANLFRLQKMSDQPTSGDALLDASFNNTPVLMLPANQTVNPAPLAKDAFGRIYVTGAKGTDEIVAGRFFAETNLTINETLTSNATCQTNAAITLSSTSGGTQPYTVEWFLNGASILYTTGINTSSGDVVNGPTNSFSSGNLSVTVTTALGQAFTENYSMPFNPSLASAAGTNAQTGCINFPITNIVYNTLGASGGSVTGLPAGLIGTWSANTFTISGTPTQSGVFNYTITIVGDCPGVSNTISGSVTINSIPNTISLTSAVGTNAQTLSFNPIANITYSTTGATGANFSGLPAGLSAVWANNTTTISGIPSVSGTFNYTVAMTGGCTNGTNSAVGVINVIAPPVITSFSPASAQPGDAVTITGTGFNALAANNIVFFGATRAVVTSASATSVTVTVPLGATYAPITLLNVSSVLAGASQGNFNPIYAPAKNNITTSDFLPKVDFTTGVSPFSVAIGDLDGDGKADLAIANYSSNTVSVLRNTAISGAINTSSFAPKVDFATSAGPVFVAIGDLNGDGKADLAIANYDSHTVSVLRNTAISGAINTSSFAPKVDFATSSAPYSVAIGDLDGDGKADLAIAIPDSHTVSVLRNTASSGTITTGSFAAYEGFNTGSNPRAVAIGDLDGDGKADLATANHSSNTVSVLRNTAISGAINTSSFAPKVDFATSSAPFSVAIGDLDGDGKADLATANPDSHTVSVLRNTASSGTITTGSFAAYEGFNTGSNPRAVAIGDLDGDGKADLATANRSSNTVSVLRNTAISGAITVNSFAAKVDFTTGSNPYSVAIGDLDGDRKLDLAVVNNGSNNVSILRNADSPPVINSFSPTSGCTGVSVSIAINGNYLNGASAVTIGGTAVTSFVVNSPTQITATVNAPISGVIQVTTPGGTVSSAGSFAITPNNTIALTSAAGTNAQTRCINAAINNITYSTLGATGASATGLPAGVTGTWAANVFTIAGSPSVSGTFPYTVTMIGGCTGGTNTASGSIIVRPNNTISLTSAAGTNAQTRCINTAITNITYATTTATGATVSGLPTGVTGSWAANVFTISGTPNVSGTFNYTITMTGGCTGGTNTASGSIIVNPTNTITLTSAVGTNAQTQCINNSITNITYSTTGATGATVTGLPAGVTGLWAANVFTISGTPSVSGTFNYNVTMTGGCTGGTNTASGSIIVRPNNTISLTSAAGTNAQTRCINTAITNITYATTTATGATVSGLPTGVTGTWAANVFTITGTPSVSGTFNYIITMTGGCTGGTNTATGSITVNPTNTITLSSAVGTNAQTQCINTAITNITYATTTATGATVSGLPTGVTGSWAANVFIISGTPTVSGTFNYTITMTGGCTGGTNTASGSIIVRPNNTIALTSAAGTNAQTRCINTGITNITYSTTGATGATATGLPTGVTGAWAANVFTISGTPSVSGTFSYTVTMTGGCGTNTASGSIIVRPNNTIALTSAVGTDAQTRCINTAITNITYATTTATGATVSGLPTGVTGSWAANVFTISGTPNVSGTFNYTITMTGGCTGGTNSATGSITVTPNNVISLTSAVGTNVQTRCINTSITNITYSTTGATGATATGLPAGVTGTWASNVFTISGTPTVSGIFNYTVSMLGGCGTSTLSGTLTVNANTINLTSAAGTNAQTRCINTALTNITYSTTGATGATVSGLPTGVTGTWATNVFTITGTPSVSGTFNYIITMTGGCTGGTNTATGSITVNPTNTITLSSAVGTNAQTLCINTAIANITYATTTATGATVSGLPTGVTGSWAANVFTISGSPSVSGTFNYTVTMTGGCTGGANTATGTIVVRPNNTIALSSAAGTNAQTRCVNTPITNITYNTTGATGATVTGLPAGVNGSWASNVFTISGTPTVSGTFNYTVTMTGGCTGGTNTVIGSITVNPTNTITLTSAVGTNNQTVIVNTPITNITYATTGATGATTAGMPAGLVGTWGSNVFTISGSPTATGIFNYTITMTGGCTGGNNTISGTINVLPNSIVLSALDIAACQSFNLLPTTGTSTSLPLGWFFTETGTGANTSYTAGNGSVATGDTYSLGLTGNTERSLGVLFSGTLNPTIGARIFNNTANTISILTINYTGETWRVGTAGRSDRLDFQLSTNATSLITGTWTDVNNLDYSNVSQSTTSSGSLIHSSNLSHTLKNLSIAPGTSLWIRWTDFDATGADDAMAIDDICITPVTPCSPNVVIASSDADNVFCPSTVVTFTANATNGGTAPLYQWTLNGANVGSNGSSNTFTTNSLSNNDVVSVILTSNANCAILPQFTASGITNQVTQTTYYLDADADGYGNVTNFTLACNQPVGYVTNSTDCNDNLNMVNPVAPELCNNLDDDCDGLVDDNLIFVNYYNDLDGDNYGDPLSYVLACSQPVGYVINNSDCSPNEGTIWQLLSGFIDTDLDGFTVGSLITNICSGASLPTGYSSLSSGIDCNDAQSSVNPAATEVCNTIDDDCDGTIDDGLIFVDYYNDQDGDTYGAGTATNACQSPSATYVTNNTDCNDSNPSLNAITAETCNSFDDDCDGTIDNGLIFVDYYNDLDGDTYGAGTANNLCADPGMGYVTNNTDCNDSNASLSSISPETCNNFDDDCDGTVDNGLVFVNYYNDLDGDTYGAGTAINACQSPGANYVTNNTDCNDSNASLNSISAETCNSFDDDCDGTVDNGLIFVDYYNDLDGDTYGAGIAISACQSPGATYVNNNTDCNNNNAAIKPGAAEICGNGIDEDCSGSDLICSGNGDLNTVNVISIGNYGTGTQTTLAINFGLGADNIESPGTGIDRWYQFTAQANAIRLELMGSSSAGDDNDIALYDYTTLTGQELIPLDIENDVTPSNLGISTDGGNEVLYYDQLEVGATYWICARNLNNIYGSSSLRVAYLRGSAMDIGLYTNYTNTYSNTCQNFKCKFKPGASYYTFSMWNGNIAQGTANWIYSTAPTTTSNATTVLQLGKLVGANINNVPVQHTVKVDAHYGLKDAYGNTEQVVGYGVTPGVFTLNAEADLNLRAIDRCPVYKSPTFGSIATNRSVCGTSKYIWQLTMTAPSPGLPQTVNGPVGGSRILRMNAIPGIASNQQHNVSISSLHVDQQTQSNYGSTQCMRTYGFAGAPVIDGDNIYFGEKESRIMIYPNPNQGEGITINLEGMEGDVNIELLDATGRLLEKTTWNAEGYAQREWRFAQTLSAGLYEIRIQQGSRYDTQRMLVVR